MKNILKPILAVSLTLAMLFTSVPFVGIDLQASAIDSRVEKAVQTAIAIANDNAHGYSQSSRRGPDYDCSSLVYYAFSSAGFSLSPTWFNTANMSSALKNAGFIEITNINLSNSNSLQRGDILWKSGHTEIYIGNNQLVGAHSDRGYPQTGDQPGNEISVGNYYYKGSNNTVWTKVYRYASSSAPTILSPYLSNVSATQFTINCTLNDVEGISSVWLNIYGPNGSDGYSVSATNGFFSHTISTEKYGGSGCFTVHVYAIDTTGIQTSYAFDGIMAVNDYESPIITNVYASDISDERFTVNCNLFDNVGVSKVWLNIYGPQGDEGYSVFASNGVFSHTIQTEQFGGPGIYIVHIYAFDNAGNETGYALNNIIVERDNQMPEISNVSVSNISDEKFTVVCELFDNVGVDRVWLNIYGPNGSDGYSCEAKNGIFSHTIYTKNYGGAGKYHVHIYVFDKEGNEVGYALNGIDVETHMHSYNSKITKQPTHTATGVMTHTCVCGDEYTEIIKTTTEHSYNVVVTEPNCTEQGFTTYTCVCGDSYVDNYVKPNGHKKGAWIVTKPATTTSIGERAQYCIVCSKMLDKQTIPKLIGKVQSVSVPDLSLDYKTSATIKQNVVVDSGVAYTVAYSSSNIDVAYIDENGEIYASGKGNAEITVTVTDEFGNTVTDTCNVEVTYNFGQWLIIILLFGWIWY